MASCKVGSELVSILLSAPTDHGGLATLLDFATSTSSGAEPSRHGFNVCLVFLPLARRPAGSIENLAVRARIH